MTTLKQLAANRLNAKKSTGPKTETGKARSSQNAITHGAFARLPILPCEDPDTYQSIADQAYAAFPPTTPTIALLVDQLIADLRTLHRLKRIEYGLTTRFLAMTYSDEADYYREAAEDDPEHRDILLAKAAECDRLQEACSHAEESLLARAFARDTDNTDPLPKLHRYLTTTTRRIDKTMKELSTLQNEPNSTQSVIAKPVDEVGSSLSCSPLPAGEGMGVGYARSNRQLSDQHFTHVEQSILQNEPNSPCPQDPLESKTWNMEQPHLQNEPICSEEPGPSIQTPDSCLLTPDLQNEPISKGETSPNLTPDSCLLTPNPKNEPIFIPTKRRHHKTARRIRI